MTNLNPNQRHDREHGVGWVSLADGVRMDPAWLSRHVPRRCTAWQHADTALQRLQLAHLIQQAATTPDQDRDDYRSVHVEWTDTESFVLPVLTATAPHAAADALRWRQSTLDLARERAQALRLRGAVFPLRTIRGQECSGY
jgi:hypothetical protein